MARKKTPKKEIYTDYALEEGEQMALMEWAELEVGKYPELEWLYHNANGELRNKTVAKRLKALGVKPGIPDLCLPVSRGGYHGLYIELKRPSGEGKISDDQARCMEFLISQGYFVRVCLGFDEAVAAITSYLEKPYSKKL